MPQNPNKPAPIHLPARQIGQTLTREQMLERHPQDPRFPKYGYVLLCKKDGNVVPKP